ncbi:aldo/keto reductase [Marinicella litoralis]|uniref:Aryl-alcohol dehydrogenase-like predicted oxidoreductase n=1 Tax=Marinicella litoralis TaxID=644220 RepID=A0A4R6XVF0_9GAMM|nr:aldo/keto reductase [Marinicella litoralis]TDR22529.1 aryl-alcohol dehydrogenase-like predicted oxidoreductase [Marinicella litoralis]
MKYKSLINATFRLSEIGLGCASYWGKKQFSEKQAHAVVHQAIASGINYFDTGHSYSEGNAERRLGRALANQATRDLIISSKVGTRVGRLGKLYKDFSANWIKQSCELSLQQLQVDHLPLFFLHGPNPENFNHETYQTLDQLKAAGKIGMVGVNTFDDHIIDLSVASEQFECLMLDYNIFTQHRLATIKHLTGKKMDVIVAGGLGGGLFQQGFNRVTNMKKLWYWLRAFKNNRQQMIKAKEFGFLNQQQQASAIQIALAYVLQAKEISSTLVGTTSHLHLRELVQASDLTLSPKLIEKIQALA